MSLAASVMILVILLIRTLAIHRLPKRFFLLLWVVVLLRLLVPFSLPSPTSIYSLLPTEPLPAPDIKQELSVPSVPPAASPWEAFELNPVSYTHLRQIKSLFSSSLLRFILNLPLKEGCHLFLCIHIPVSYTHLPSDRRQSLPPGRSGDRCSPPSR